MKRHFLFDVGGPNEGDGGSDGTPVENQLKGQASPDEITAWKNKYKQGIYAHVVSGESAEDPGCVGYFQNPNRHHINIAMSKASADKALNMYEELAKLTFISGSEDVLKNDEMFFGLTQNLKTKMDGKKGKLVNL